VKKRKLIRVLSVLAYVCTPSTYDRDITIAMATDRTTL
jgi:hypothetical protein